MALILESLDDVEVKMFKTEGTMDYEQLTATNLSSISRLLAEIYPYSLKAATDSSAPQPSQRPSTTSRRLRDCDDNKSHTGYTQVHTQLPTQLASELQSALPALSYSNTTEWLRDMARKTIHEAAEQIR